MLVGDAGKTWKPRPAPRLMLAGELSVLISQNQEVGLRIILGDGQMGWGGIC